MLCPVGSICTRMSPCPADPSSPADGLILGDILVDKLLGARFGVYARVAAELATDRGDALRCVSTAALAALLAL